jgi:hypothetical protein
MEGLRWWDQVPVNDAALAQTAVIRMCGMPRPGGDADAEAAGRSRYGN